MAYGFYYDLDLFSDFTYFLTDTNRGDQFEQRTSAGWPGWTRATRFSANGSAAKWRTRSACRCATIGSTTAFTRRKIACEWTRLDSSDRQHSCPPTTQADRFTDTQVGFYAENKIQWAEKFRSVAALRGDLEYFDVTSLRHSGQFRHGVEVPAQPEIEFDFRPVVANGILFAGRLQFSQQRRPRHDADGGTDFGGESFPRYARHENSRPDPDQRRGNRRAHSGRCHICKAPFRSGISTAIPNCSRVATPEARWLPHSRATAMASNGRTTTRHGNIWPLISTLRIPSPVLRVSTDDDDAAPGSPGRHACARGGRVGDFSRASRCMIKRIFGESAPALLWPARFDVGRNLSLQLQRIAQCGGRLSNHQDMARFGRSFESAQPPRS